MVTSGSWQMRWFHCFNILHVQIRKWGAKNWWNYWYFWKEIKNFTYRTGPYSYCSSCFENDDARSGQSDLWCEIHSLPLTELLGFVACQTTSKHLGIRSTERSWSSVKTIKNGKRANIGGESLDKRTILYTLAMLEEDRLQRNLDSSNDPNYAVFGDDDLK